MRRSIVLFMVALLFAEYAEAQTKSLVTQSDSVEYLTPEEYAMMLDRNDRFLIRADILSAGVEWEFANNLSILAQAGFEAYNQTDGSADEFSRVEMRFYFPTENFSRSSLNGPYVSVGGELFTTFPAPSILNTSLFYAKLGLQRRFLGNGLADFGFRFGYQNEVFDDWRDGEYRGKNSQQSYVFESTASIGLGLTFNKNQDLDYERLCPVLKCYSSEKFLLKFDLANALRIEFGNNFQEFVFTPSIAVEQKLGNLPFSLQTKAAVDLWVVSGDEDYQAYNMGDFARLRAEFEGRYYYNLRARMRKGKTGNSLSGNYFALGYLSFNEWDIDSENVPSFHHNGMFVKTGIQRTFGEKLYFDVYVGAGIFEDRRDRRETGVFGAVECGFKF